MTPIKLTLQNFCQHSIYIHNYCPGVTGISGNNGAGKTNFSYVGQQFAITGKTNTDKTKKDFLKWGTSKGSTCFEFIHDGLEYVLTRGLHNTKVLLTQGDNEWKQQDANDCMTNILGLTPEVFFEVCFVEQGNLWDILNMSHAKRMEYFQKLTDAWQAEGIRKQLDNGLKLIPTYPDRTDLIKELTDKKLVYSMELMKEEAVLSGLIAGEMGKANSRIDNARNSLLLMTREDYDKKLFIANFELSEAKQKICDATKEAVVVDPVEYPEELVRKQAAQREYNIRLEAYDKIVLGYNSAVKAKAELIKPPIPTDVKMKQTEVSAADIKQKLAGVCESCNRPFEGAEDINRVNLNAELELLRNNYRELKKAFDTATEKRADYDKNLVRLNLRIDSFNEPEELKTLGEKVEFNPEDLVEATKIYSEYIKCRDENITNQELINLLNKTLASKEAAQKTAIEVKFIEPEEAVAAQKILDDAKEVEDKIIFTRLEMTRHDTNLKSTEETIARYDKEKETQVKANDLRKRFEKARTILHRDKLPKVVMSSMLKGINHYMATMLQSFNMDFHAYLNDDFDFIIKWGEEEHPANVLSGGEKVILAISFHIGLARLLTGNIPFMILDEPTNHIDKHNKPLLRDALMTLKGAGASGCEFFLVTHDEVLQPVFDREIEIEKAGKGNIIFQEKGTYSVDLTDGNILIEKES